MFDDNFIRDLPSDPLLALRDVCIEFHETHMLIPEEQEADNYARYIDALALAEYLLDTYGFQMSIPEIPGHAGAAVETVVEFFDQLEDEVAQALARIQIEQSKARFASLTGRGFVYEFSDGDLNKIQQLTNELRDLVTQNVRLEEGHRNRLLKRLEKFQRELHKRVSDLDRFWGLVGEAGVVLGKLGHDAKPIVDRIREIVSIVWWTQARVEELPSGTPLDVLNSISGNEE